MSNERIRGVLADCVKRHRGAIIMYLLSVLLSATVFIAYGVMSEPLVYAAVLTGAIGLALLGVSAARSLKAARLREEAARALLSGAQLPPPETLSEADHQAMLETLRCQLAEIQTRASSERRETADLMTAWVHQIKTPIAVMRMILAETDSEQARLAREELFRIESYADMMLRYIRLGSDSNDLVIREYALDDMIRESIRGFAPMFIRRKLSMRYEGTDARVVTDRKWFICILEQFLSNAVKYTPSGGVTVTVEGTRVCVRDTGIGIAAEDLPRIFEKGYTGINGRPEKHSSGLGLYLAKSAADKLGLALNARSRVGEGSCFVLELGDKARPPQSPSQSENEN